MRKSGIVVLGLLCATVFTSCFVANVQAPIPTQELFYDDGEFEAGVVWDEIQALVLFSIPTGWTGATIVEVKIYISYYTYVDDLPFLGVRVIIYDSTARNELYSGTIPTYPSTGWFIVTGLSVDVPTATFWVAIECPEGSSIAAIGSDQTEPISGFSYYRYEAYKELYDPGPYPGMDFGIRVVVQQRVDSDGDGLFDDDEVNVYGTDPLNPDTDDDGLLDGQEVITYGTNPLDPDTDYDGLLDGQEVIAYGTDPLDPDTDDDGLLDGEEILSFGTDPLKSDTDDDGFSDGTEVQQGTNPLDPNDYPRPPPTVPELELTIPLITSMLTALYLATSKRQPKRKHNLTRNLNSKKLKQH